MNIRHIALLIVFAALPVQVQAADAATTAAVAGRAAQLQKLSSGQVVTSNSQQYQMLPGVRAAERPLQEAPQQTLTRMGGSQLIETKGTFVIFTAAQPGAASVMQVNGATSYPTALNPRTGGVGILPGTLNVKLKNMASAAAVATDHGLDMVRAFPQLLTVFYRVRPGQDVLAAAASLAADARVASAEVEIIENVAISY